MAEWLKALAWKTTPASCTESHRNISSRNRFNDFPPKDASRCEPVNVAVCQGFRGDLTRYCLVEGHLASERRATGARRRYRDGAAGARACQTRAGYCQHRRRRRGAARCVPMCRPGRSRACRACSAANSRRCRSSTVRSAAQVHPLIATRWSRRLAPAIVVAANEGFLPGRVNFAIRSHANVNLLQWLRTLPFTPSGFRIRQRASARDRRQPSERRVRTAHGGAAGTGGRAQRLWRELAAASVYRQQVRYRSMRCISPISGIWPVNQPFAISNSTTGCGLFTSMNTAA